MDICGYLLEAQHISLSEQQRQAVMAGEGTVLLLAVPGAGKTTVVAARIANLILNCGADPKRILTLTFNRAAAQDMQNRWNRLFGQVTPAMPAFSTIHSFCYTLLRDYARGRGTQVPQLMEGQNSGSSKAKVLMGLYRDVTGQFMNDDVLGEVTNAIGYCVNMQLGQQEISRLDLEIPGFEEVFRRYVTYKRENGLMDFEDMLLFANTALERSEVLRQRYRERYDFIHVDEAQDTSKIQHEILRQIVNNNLFMVGDEDQSIYSFRGAYPQGLTQFFSTYQGARLLKLEQNYRSTGAIVESATQLIQTNVQRYDKKMYTRREKGAELTILRGLDMEEEYQGIADLLEKVPPDKSCAVLYRTSFSGIGLATQLRHRGISYFSRETRLGYGSDFITRDMANLMRLAQDPGDQQAFRQGYFKLGCGIPREIAAEAAEEKRKDILKWVIEKSEYSGKNTGKLSWARRVLASMAEKKPQKQMDMILEDLEYLCALEKKGQGGYILNAAFQKLAILRRFAAMSGDTQEFLERLGEAEKLLDCPGANHLTLSTVHSAKGQEFDWVIIPDALDGIFPLSDAVEYKAMGKNDPMEEEARLFYTAMTRAKDRLILVAPASCMGRRLPPSRFVTIVEGGRPMLGNVPLVPGVRMSHAFFGVGELLSIDSRRGLVEILFKIGGKKKFTLESLGDPKLFQVL